MYLSRQFTVSLSINLLKILQLKSRNLPSGGYDDGTDMMSLDGLLQAQQSLHHRDEKRQSLSTSGHCLKNRSVHDTTVMEKSTLPRPPHLYVP